MKKLFVALFALAALAAAAVAAVVAFLRRFLPDTEGRVELDGIHGPVEIVRDRWGVPHIYANSEEDLFFAQGYVHAQDRMWQMELQRRAGAGRLAEVLGEPALEIDRAFRTVGLNRAAEDEAAGMSGETRRALQAYSAGVNAWMRLKRGSLSVEFRLLGFEPQPWRPVDSFYWAKMLSANLSGNWTSEVLRARLTRQVGADLAADLEPVYPASNPVTVPGDGGAAGQPNGWRSDALRDALRLVEQMMGGPATPPPALKRAPLAGVIPLNPAASNQWVVDGAHSATGQPLLANDTHMSVAMPALWYQVHLSGGRYQVAGVSLPGIPGVVVGHNDQIAWGMTTGWQDAQDLYVEKPNPANGREFEFQGKWEKAEVVREVILVKGRSAPLVEEVVITRHGPIVSKLVGEEHPLALRWTGHDVTDPIRAFLSINRAQSWDDFRGALGDWVTPPHNFVYADTAGNIGFVQAGAVPVRKGDGMAPAPGWTGEYEWERFLTVDEIPQVFNPQQGWIAVANNVVVGADYPHFLSSDLEDPVRATRIAELLQSKDTFSAAEFTRFQRDLSSAHARRFVKHLLKIQPTNSREAAVLDLLRAWDYQISADSVAASIYHVCQLNALHTIFARHLGDHTDAYIGIDITGLADFSLYQGRTSVRLLDMLDDPRDTVWLRDPESGIPEAQTEALHRALRITLQQMIAELGPDMETWTWGRLHKIEFAHVAGAVKPLNLLFNRGPYPMAGDNETLLRATTRPAFPFKLTATIDALRFIADVSDWDRCQIMVAGGQSGHVASKHYDDLIPLWRDGLTIAMPFSRAAVERSASARQTLHPKQRGARTNGADPV